MLTVNMLFLISSGHFVLHKNTSMVELNPLTTLKRKTQEYKKKDSSQESDQFLFVFLYSSHVSKYLDKQNKHSLVQTNEV